MRNRIMAFKLMQEERRYLDILKETKMLRHVGKGPVNPAPSEKEASTSTDDAQGQGTVQAGTTTPNAIPKVKDLAKQLAKEGIDFDELTLDELSEMLFTEPEQPKVQLTQEDVDNIVSGGVEADIQSILEKKDKCPKCECNPCKCE